MSNVNDPRSHAPDLEPPLEAAVWSVLREPLDADAIARVIARAEAALPNVSPESDMPTPARSTRLPNPFLSRSLIMKSLSTVAAVIVVVGATFMLQPTSNAFGDVIKQLRSARSMTYVTRAYFEGKTEPIESKVSIAEDGRQRNEQKDGSATIIDASSQLRLTLINSSKMAIVPEFDKSRPNAAQNPHTVWLQSLKAHGEKPDKQLGKKTLDGRVVEGFVAKQGTFEFEVWVDPQTKALVQVEYETPVKGSTITRIVMTDFKFDVTLDESLFSFEVPQDYRVMKLPALPKAINGEESIVEALRGFTKRSGGKFPNSITEWGEWAALVASENTNGKLNDESLALLSRLGSIPAFLQGFAKADYEYLGKGKSLEDKRCIVFWHRTAEGKLRAIYNDLSVAEVEKKDLP